MPQTSLGKLGMLDWGDWAYGLTSGFISGGATAVTSGVVAGAVDPSKDFAFGTPQSIHLMLWMFLVSGLLAAFAFLRNKPLPSVVQTETTVTRREVQPTVAQPVAPPPVVTTTEKVTKIEPVVPTEKENP